MLDKERKAQQHIAYIKRLIHDGFSGTVTVHLFEGGIRSLTKENEPMIKLNVKETVKIK